MTGAQALEPRTCSGLWGMQSRGRGAGMGGMLCLLPTSRVVVLDRRLVRVKILPIALSRTSLLSE